MELGFVAGALNNLGSQYVETGLKNGINLPGVFSGALIGGLVGSAIGAGNGLIQESIYQSQLKDGYSKWNNSQVADAAGEFTSQTTSNLEASNPFNLWPLGHNYNNSTFLLDGSICIGLQTGRCTIIIDPYKEMVPRVPTYYAPKP